MKEVKLTKISAIVRTGGKGTMRRKKKFRERFHKRQRMMLKPK